MVITRMRWVVLCLVVGFTLQGCSSKATGTAPSTTIEVTGSVQLPTGSTIDPSTLTVNTSIGTASVSKGGTFGVTAFPDGPQFTYVAGANGRPILFGFPSPGEPSINARTTAEAMVFFALGYCRLPPAERQQAYGAIAASPGFAALESAIQAALLADPGAFTSATPTYPAAARTALATFFSSLAAAPTPSVATRNEAPSRAGDILVNPSNGQSGITIVNYSPSVAIQNIYLRRAMAFFDRVSYATRTDQGTVITPSPLVDAIAPVEIAPVTALKGWKTLPSAIYSGDYTWAPKETARFSLPSATDAYWTRYRVSVVGMGLESVDEARLSAEQAKALEEIRLKGVLFDALVPTLATYVFPYAKEIGLSDATYGGSAAKDLLAAFSSVGPEVAAAVKKGNLREAYNTLSSFLVTSSSGQKAMMRLLEFVAGKMLSEDGMARFEELFKGRADAMLKLLDVVLVSVNFVGMDHDLLLSSAVDFFDVTTVQTPINLTPATVTAYNGMYATPSFAVNVPSASGSGLVLEYAWQNTAQHGKFCDLSGQASHCNSFTSTVNQGTYLANATGQGTDTLTVSVTAVDMTGDKPLRYALGSASSVITVAAIPDVGLPPTNLAQSRCMNMNVTDHIVPVGGTVTGTGSGYNPLNCGGDIPPLTPPTWTWSHSSTDANVVSGCTANSQTCSFKVTAPTGTAGNRYITLCVYGKSVQGAWTSCDYYAVVP